MNSYSQCGEDFHIHNRLMQYLPKEGGFFVDVGCADAVVNSNTFFFEKELGYSGLCIDGNPIWAASHNMRKNSTFINAVISERGEEQYFYECTLPELSGISKNPDLDLTEQMVTSVPLSDILRDHNVERIHLMSIDVEGHELDVLKSFDIEKYKPGIIIIEHCTLGTFNHSGRKHLMEMGYFAAVTTDLNHIMVKKW